MAYIRVMRTRSAVQAEAHGNDVGMISRKWHRWSPCIPGPLLGDRGCGYFRISPSPPYCYEKAPFYGAFLCLLVLSRHLPPSGLCSALSRHTGAMRRHTRASRYISSSCLSGATLWIVFANTAPLPPGTPALPPRGRSAGDRASGRQRNAAMLRRPNSRRRRTGWPRLPHLAH